MPYCKYCGAEHDADAAFCTECGKPIKPRKKHPPEPKPENEKKPIPGFPEPANEEEAKAFARMKAEHRRIYNKSERKIGDTIYVVYECVPEDCTDELFEKYLFNKVKRMILEDTSRHFHEEREAQKEKRIT